MRRMLQVIQGGKMIQMQEFDVPSRSVEGKVYTVRAAVTPSGELTNWFCPCEAWKWNGQCFHVGTVQTEKLLEEYAELPEMKCDACGSTAIAGTTWGDFKCLVCDSKARLR